MQVKNRVYVCNFFRFRALLARFVLDVTSLLGRRRPVSRSILQQIEGLHRSATRNEMDFDDFFYHECFYLCDEVVVVYSPIVFSFRYSVRWCSSHTLFMANQGVVVNLKSRTATWCKEEAAGVRSRSSCVVVIISGGHSISHCCATQLLVKRTPWSASVEPGT